MLEANRGKSCLLVLAAIAIAVVVAGCSTGKNTAKSRWWHAFNARYNTYYNGSLAYIDGSLEKENGNKDNFTELIPLYTVGNKASRELGKGNFDKAIEKCQKAIKLHSIKRKPEWTKSRRKTARDLEWLNRREYNPFLWKAWMLMGRSQFYEGDFEGAASTFNYMCRLYATQPAIYGRARAWLAKSYIENDFLYDAEDVIRNMQRDSLHWRARKEWDYTYADYYIHTGDYRAAIPYLRKVIKHEMRRKQRAREWYLLGQLHAELGQEAEAYKAFAHVVRLNPPYELEFNARIAQTEVLAGKQSRKMISRLRRMARSDKNAEYLDQVYYALGNIYLSQRDTARALSAYERGNEKATRAGVEKGVLLLKLGDLYWEMEKFADAQRCYGEAIGLLDKERKDYEQLSNRSKVLDELVPYTDAVHLQDSLQELARMSDKDRNAAIDRVIAALKKKEKEEQRARDEEAARQTMQQNGAMGDRAGQNRATARAQLANQQNSGLWYFYNQMAVIQGRQQFQKIWGKRENVDDWQRNNKTVVAGMGDLADGMGELSDEARDSMLQAQAVQDSLDQIADSAQNDPHRREYYLAQIPFTEDQVFASNLVIMDGLYHSGVIFKDKLDNLPLAEKALTRLLRQYPTYDHMDDAYYHLFLLYNRMGRPDVAEAFVDSLRLRYPGSTWTTLLTDPNFVANQRMGVQLEDSLYSATYDAFKADRYREVEANASLSETRFPLGANRDKFLFVGGLGKLNAGDADACLADMDSLVRKFPQSKLAGMAGMIINGVKAGRKLRGGKFDLGDVWTRRSAVLTDQDSLQKKGFSNERNASFLFMLVYNPDSVDENRLLFQVARYNFTSYLVRDFDISIEDADGLHRMQVSGFRNYDEALQYARQLLRQQSVARHIGTARPVIISEENLPLLGTTFSYDDYAKFYTTHFAPLKVSTFQLLTEPAEVATEPEPSAPEPEPTETDVDNFLNETFVGADEPPTTPVTVIPTDSVGPQAPATVIPTDNMEPQVPVEGTTVVPVEDEPTPVAPARPVAPAQPTSPADTLAAPRPPLNLSDGADIILDDEELEALPKPKATEKPDGPAVPKQPDTPTTTQPVEKQREAFDLEDEYYDLDGF